ncbi:MAG: transposase [Bacteroidota bacterium]|nr:transposase [Bacteroidota bacterium]
MKFVKGYIYHIYNQGNNRQKIFFNRDNYLFFLKKIKVHIIPYSDILAWCLMPNHFHLMVRLNRVVLEPHTEGFALSETLGCQRTLNQSIGIMLRSYTNAINKQQNRTGSLFRKETKAECLNCPNGITPSFYNTEFKTQIQVDCPERQYPQVCFNYIHQNPVKAELVKTETAWEFSSAQDFAGMRNGALVNKTVASEYIIF